MTDPTRILTQRFTDIITTHNTQPSPARQLAAATETDLAHRIEHAIRRTQDAYDALWDLMPAIAAFATLIWLINVFSR